MPGVTDFLNSFFGGLARGQMSQDQRERHDQFMAEQAFRQQEFGAQQQQRQQAQSNWAAEMGMRQSEFGQREAERQAAQAEAAGMHKVQMANIQSEIDSRKEAAQQRAGTEIESFQDPKKGGIFVPNPSGPELPSPMQVPSGYTQAALSPGAAALAPPGTTPMLPTPEQRMLQAGAIALPLEVSSALGIPKDQPFLPEHYHQMVESYHQLNAPDKPAANDLALRIQAQKLLDEEKAAPGSHAPYEVKGATDYLANKAAQAQGVVIRNETGRETLAERKETFKEKLEDRKASTEGFTPTQLDSIKSEAATNPGLDLVAWQYLAYGRSALPYDRSPNQANTKKYIARAAQIQEDHDMAPADVIAFEAGIKGNAGALAKITGQEAMADVQKRTLDKNIVTARQLSAAYGRGDNKFKNAVKAAWDTGVSGDPNATALAAQLHGVAGEWAKMVQGASGSGSVHVSGQADADKQIGIALSNNTLNHLFDAAVIPDSVNRMNSFAETKQGLMKNFSDMVRGNTATTPSSTTTPTTVPQAVKDLLKDKPAKVYKLSDGSSWNKKADGTIEKQ